MDVLTPLSEHISGLHDFRKADIARDYHIRGKHGIFIFAMDNAYKLFSPEENPPTEDGIGSGKGQRIAGEVFQIGSDSLHVENGLLTMEVGEVAGIVHHQDAAVSGRGFLRELMQTNGG